MKLAAILVNVKIGSEEKVVEELKEKTDGVVGAAILYGVYDIIALIEADTTDGLKDIHSTIRRVNKVCSALHMIATPDQAKSWMALLKQVEELKKQRNTPEKKERKKDV